MIIGSFDQDSAAFGILYPFYECVFLFSKNCFIYAVSISLNQSSSYQVSLGKLIDRVYCCATASQNNPLHVSSFSPSQTNYSIICQFLQANWVNSFLIYDDEGFVLVCTNLSLEINYFLASFISEFSLILDHVISVNGIREEKLRIHLSFLILQGDIASQDVTVFQAFRHIRISGSVIKDQPSDQFSIIGKPMNHMHNFNHMQIDGFVFKSDNFDSLNNDVNQLIGEVWGQFCTKGSSSDACEQGFIYILLWDLKLFKECQSLFSSEFISFGDHSWMNLLLNKPLSLLHQFPNQQYIRSSSIT